MHFGDRIAQAIAAYGPLCIGLDPHEGRIPALFGAGLAGIEAFFEAVLHRARGTCGIIKPQIAFFERHGPDGLAVLARLCAKAKALGYLVLLDAKRGDIGSTASAYAHAYLGPEAWLECDAITVNPYMGMDTLEPFLNTAGDHGKGVVVLVRTSNPGAADFEDWQHDGTPLYMQIAQTLAPFARERRGPRTGWSSLMIVAGATAPAEARRLRAALPHCPFLVPGYGAQGASAAEALAASRDGQGVVVNSSRAVLYPHGAEQARSARAWERLFDAALRRAQDDLQAVSD